MNSTSVSDLLWMLAYLGLLLGAGYALLCVLGGPARRTPAEIFGLSILMGCGGVPFLHFWLSLAGVQPSRMLLSLLLFVVVAGVAWLGRARRWVKPAEFWPNLTRADALGLPSLVLLLWAAGLIAYSTFTYPLVEWDAFAIWGFKAKVLYSAPLPALQNYFQDASLGFSHLDYPLLVPFLTAGGYAAMGAVNDTLGKAPGYFLFLGLIVFLYGAVRSRLGRPVALALVALFASAPIVVRWASVGTADLPLAAFFAGSAVYATRWLAGGEKSDLRLAAFFGAAGVFTKNEGLPMAVITLVVVLAFGRGRRRPAGSFPQELAPALAALVCLLPWAIFRHGLPHIDENYPSHLNPTTVAANWPRWRLILGYFCYNTFDPIPYYCLWVLALGAFLLGQLQRAGAAPWILLALLAGVGLADGLAYLISPQPLEQLLLVTLDRLLLQVLPVAVLLTAFSLAPIFPVELRQD